MQNELKFYDSLKMNAQQSYTIIIKYNSNPIFYKITHKSS